MQEDAQSISNPNRLVEKPLLLFVAIALGIGIFYAGYFFGKLKIEQKKKENLTSSTPEQQPMTEPTVGLETDSKNKEENLPSPTTQAKPTQTPPADWRQYTDTKNGYTIKYPPEWYLQEPNENSSTVSFLVKKTEGESTGVWISVKENPDKLPIQDWWRNYIQAFGDAQDMIEKTKRMKISVDNQEAYFVQTTEDWASRPFTQVFVAKDDKVYIIATDFTDEDNQYYPLFTLMLSSFRFLK